MKFAKYAALALMLLPGVAFGQTYPAPVLKLDNSTVTATGGTAAQSIAQKLGETLSAKDCGAAMDGVTDDTAKLNACITTLSNAGGGTLLITPGSTVWSGLVLKTGVWVRGATQGGSKVLCAASPCVTGGIGGVQLYGAGLTDLTFGTKVSGDASDTVIQLPIVSQSEIGRLLIQGFTTGTALSMGNSAPATTITNSNLGSNVIWNNVHDITVYGCATCVLLSGHYTSAGASPNPPDQVLTQNKFSNLNLYYVNGKGIDINHAADTNDFFGGLINLIGTGSIGVAQADDVAYASSVNVYVGSNKFYGVAFSHNTTTSLTMFSGGFSTTTEGFGVETDIDTTQAGLVGINMPNASSYRICGKRLDSGSGLLLGCQQKGVAWEQTYGAGTITTSQNLAVPVGFSDILFTGTSAATSVTLTLPCTPPDRTRMRFITTSQTLSGLTWATAGGCAAASFYGAPTVISTGAPTTLQYIASSNSWVHADSGIDPGSVALTGGSISGVTLSTTRAPGTTAYAITGTLLTGFTYQAPDYSAWIGLSGSGTLASGTVNFPLNATDGQRFSIGSTGVAVTGLNVVSANAQNVYGYTQGSAYSPGTALAFCFTSGSNSWVRCP